MCIASAISLLMILICGMATYGAYKVTFLCIIYTLSVRVGRLCRLYTLESQYWVLLDLFGLR